MDAEIMSWRAALDAELDRVLPRPAEAPTLVHEAMRYAVLGGGKRLRPLFALAIGRGLGLDPSVVESAIERRISSFSRTEIPVSSSRTSENFR